MSEPRLGTQGPSSHRDGRAPVVAVVAAAALDSSAATEFLRVLAALRALDVPVLLFEAEGGVGALSAQADLDPDGERYFDALREDGVVVHGPAALADALTTASAVVRLADPARTGEPAVFEVPRGRPLDESGMRALLCAGQVRVADRR